MDIWKRLTAILEADEKDDEDGRPERPPAYSPAPIQATKPQSDTTVSQGVAAKRIPGKSDAAKTAIQGELQQIKSMLLKADPVKKRELMKRAMELNQKLQTLKHSPESGLAAAQRKADIAARDYSFDPDTGKKDPAKGAAIGAAVAKRFGVPTPAQRTVKRMTGGAKEAERFMQADIDRISAAIDSIDDQIMQARREMGDDPHAVRGNVGANVQQLTQQRLELNAAMDDAEQYMQRLKDDPTNYKNVVQQWSAERILGAGQKRHTDIEWRNGEDDGDESEKEHPGHVEPGVPGPYPPFKGTTHGETWSPHGMGDEKKVRFSDPVLGQKRRMKVQQRPKAETRLAWDKHDQVWRRPTSLHAHDVRRAGKK